MFSLAQHIAIFLATSQLVWIARLVPLDAAGPRVSVFFSRPELELLRRRAAAPLVSVAPTQVYREH